MAHYATKRFNYWGQLGIFAGLWGAGFILGAITMAVPLFLSGTPQAAGKDPAEILAKLVTPENASLIRWVQTAGTFFIFFLPALLYAMICHVKAMKHLGFNKRINAGQVFIAIIIMLACLPLVGTLQEFTEMLPWSKASLAKFNAAEDQYNKLVAVIARMDNIFDYLISVIVIGLLPAIFEETLFRGALQNLLSRWLKKPIIAIIITSVVFSALHGSYLGFLSRFALGFVLGWMYYRTGNIWINIIAHFFNNAAAVTVLYFSTKPGEKIDPSKMEEHYPLWLGLLSIVAVVGLFIAFNKLGKKDIDRPGEEVLIPGYSNNPFDNNTAFQSEGNQQ